MLDIDDVVRLAGVRRTELVTWIEERWVLPAEEDGRWLFAEVDVARVRLIVELNRDLDIGPDAMPVVLALLDRANALHRSLLMIGAAVAELPEDQRNAVLARLLGEESD